MCEEKDCFVLPMSAHWKTDEISNLTLQTHGARGFQEEGEADVLDLS